VFKLRIDQYLALILLSLVFLLPVKRVPNQEKILPEVEFSQISPIPVLDINQEPESFIASLSAQSIMVIDIDSAAILLEKNPHQKRLTHFDTTTQEIKLYLQVVYSMFQ
jgi:D-alanyl-D-alanine carboxypeptidase